MRVGIHRTLSGAQQLGEGVKEVLKREREDLEEEHGNEEESVRVVEDAETLQFRSEGLSFDPVSMRKRNMSAMSRAFALPSLNKSVFAKEFTSSLIYGVLRFEGDPSMKAAGGPMAVGRCTHPNIDIEIGWQDKRSDILLSCLSHLDTLLSDETEILLLYPPFLHSERARIPTPESCSAFPQRDRFEGKRWK